MLCRRSMIERSLTANPVCAEDLGPTDDRIYRLLSHKHRLCADAPSPKATIHGRVPRGIPLDLGKHSTCKKCPPCGPQSSAHYAEIFVSAMEKGTGSTGRPESAFSAWLMRRSRMLRSWLADSLFKSKCEYSSITSRAYRSSVTRSGFGVPYMIARLYSGPPSTLSVFYSGQFQVGPASAAFSGRLEDLTSPLYRSGLFRSLNMLNQSIPGLA
jgi:hypothetical protein